MDEDPPLDQLQRVLAEKKGKVDKGESVVYWMRMQDLRSEPHPHYSRSNSAHVTQSKTTRHSLRPPRRPSSWACPLSPYSLSRQTITSGMIAGRTGLISCCATCAGSR